MKNKGKKQNGKGKIQRKMEKELMMVALRTRDKQ